LTRASVQRSAASQRPAACSVPRCATFRNVSSAAPSVQQHSALANETSISRRLQPVDKQPDRTQPDVMRCAGTQSSGSL
jgi:hypothetical protein